MKKLFLVVAAIALLSTSAVAQDVVWRGVTWLPDMNVGGEGESAIAPNGSNLEVTTVDMAWANAIYTVDPLTTITWVQTTFIDLGTGAGACLSFDTPDDWAGIGINNAFSTSHYIASWLNDHSSGDFALGVRTAGSHTVKLGRRTDGTVDYWFDGTLACSINDFMPIRPMTHIFLGVDAYHGSRYTDGGAVAVYTDFQSGTDYAVPEPGTILAALSILGPAGLIFRRRKSA